MIGAGRVGGLDRSLNHRLDRLNRPYRGNPAQGGRDHPLAAVAAARYPPRPRRAVAPMVERMIPNH